jgi:type 1 glutamine amidotransferase
MLATLLVAALVPQSPIRSVVLTGENNHDWRWTAPQLAGALRETGRFQVEVITAPAAWLETAPARAERGEVQLLVLDYNGPRWGEAAERGFLAAVEGGVGVAVVHAANNAFPGWREYERLVGLLWREGTGHGQYHPFDVVVVDPHHPITTGLADLKLHPDELYHRLVPGAGAEFRVLLSAFSSRERGGTGRHEPMATVASYGKGRVFHTPLGHVWTDVPATRATWSDPQLRLLLARGAEWAATGAVTLPPTPLNCLPADEAEQDFVSLFDGRTIEHWRGYRLDGLPPQGWSVVDSAIVHTKSGGGGDLVSSEEYGDFDFRFRFRLATGANSGVMWRVTEDNEQSYMSGPEYQLLDDDATKPKPEHGVGALYDLVPPEAPPRRAAGSWNDGRIVVQAGRLEHWLNGKRVVATAVAGTEWDARIAASKFRTWPFGKAANGRLCLQDHGDEVAFRDLRIRRL